MTRAQRTNAALAEIAGERERQVNVEGWTEAHDDQHDDGSLAQAAACYAMPQQCRNEFEAFASDMWPWREDGFKLGDHRRNLVKAGALIVAELERLDRLAGNTD